jgi:predicted CopG family antitoxin
MANARKASNFNLKKVIYVVTIIVSMVYMTTISVTDDVKEKLLKVASELQLKRGRRVDLNEALNFLIDQREKNVELLEEACKPMVGAKEALEELQTERKHDELRLERKIGSRQ